MSILIILKFKLLLNVEINFRITAGLVYFGIADSFQNNSNILTKPFGQIPLEVAQFLGVVAQVSFEAAHFFGFVSHVASILQIFLALYVHFPFVPIVVQDLSFWRSFDELLSLSYSSNFHRVD